MPKFVSLAEAISANVRDGDSVALGLQMEQMIPFAAGHELIRQRRRDLTLIGPISDVLFDQLIGAGCVGRVIAAWVGNVMMGSAYNFRRAVEEDGLEVINLTNFSVALALQAGALGVPFLPMRSALGSDVAKENPLIREIESPFDGAERLHAVRALVPDVTIVHVQRADELGNAHCWGNYGVMLEGVRAAKRVIVCAEEIVAADVVSSDPNRTVIPGFLVSAVCEVPYGAHPSPVQGYYKRDDAFFREYHQATKTREATQQWLTDWVHATAGRDGYIERLGRSRAEDLKTKQHAWAAPTDYGY